MKIRTILSEETLPVRQLILRPGKSLDACIFEGDNQSSSIHLGAFEKENLLGVVSLMKNNHFENKSQFQLRGMAVLPEFRDQHIAATLLLSAEKQLRENHVEILWCNAREIAVGFYEKYGFNVLGKSFEIPEIGCHYLMYKTLEKSEVLHK